MNLHASAARRSSKFNHRTEEEVFGAMILAVRHLEWNISEVEGISIWTIITGIPGAANNETIRFRHLGNAFLMESVSTGDYALHSRENEENLDILETNIATYLDLKTAAELLKVYNSFMKYGVSVEEEWTANTFNEKLRYLWEMVTFKRPWVITVALMMLNIVVFIAMIIGGVGFFDMDAGKLLKWGGNYSYNIFQGEYWRLVTNVFLHGGIAHLILNLFGLMIGGLVAENLLGKRRFLIGYLLCGIFASALSFYMHDEILSVGASGAIFGCFGIVLGLASTRLLQKKERTNLLVYFGIFVLLNLLNGLKSDIDNWAHIGGLVCGWFGGFLWSFILKKKERRRLRLSMDIAIPIMALGFSFLMVKAKHNFFPEFEKALDNYNQSADAATKYYPGDGKASLSIQQNYDSALFYFDQCTQILLQAEKIKALPKNRLKYLSKVQDMNNARKDVFYYVSKGILFPENLAFRDSIKMAESRFKTAELMINAE